MLNDEIFAVSNHRGVREYQPYNDREWTIDIAFPELMLAIEVSGTWHLKDSRFRADCERNNFLTLAGWTVLVYPASSVKAKARRRAIAEQIFRRICKVFEPSLDDDILSQPAR